MYASPIHISPEKARGPIDGRHFFSTPLFRSFYFMALSVAALIGVLYDAYLVISHSNSLSANWIVLFFFIGTGFAYSWWGVVLNFKRLQAMDSDSLIQDVEDGSPLDIALGRAAWAPQQALFYCYGAMLMMEVIIGRLLDKAGM
jgi:hypothetical protein